MYKRIVVKLGTTVLTGGTRNLDQAQMAELARQCAELHQQRHELIVVTSGAVAAGRSRLNFPDLSPTIANKQLFAAVGQSRLMLAWEAAFVQHGIHVGQILITRADVEDRARYLSACDTFAALLEQRIVPVVNENDAVATEEIKVGDNDNLSALVATVVNADLLIILTDLAGLYTADPRNDPNARLIREVQTIDEQTWKLAGGSSSGLGTGGMVTKLQAANIARHAGVDVVIAAGREPNVVTRVVGGEAIGTYFPAVDKRPESRKRWILAGPKPVGRLVVDNGAARAIRTHGRSLLPAGIVRVEGKFARGDIVAIAHAENQELARGLVAYSSSELAQIAGCKSADIAERLGYAYRDVAVHRNDMVVLEA
jgi:glutamate 5-kinase